MNKSTIATSILMLALGFPLAISMVSCSATPTSESTGQYVDDTTISTKLRAKFIDDPTVSTLNINVETFKGVVQLSGFANSMAEIKQAELLAKDTSGVKSVRNDIHLKK
ncbi:MAG: BON domain-containing protein [Methylococcaceae bacterium]|jgi:osmotically-inducible protein OsmY